MAHPRVDSDVWRHEHRIRVERLGGLGLVAVMIVAILDDAAGGPDWLVAWVVTATFLLFVGLLIVNRSAATGSEGFEFLFGTSRHTLQVVLLVGLLAVVVQSRNPGIGIGLHRPTEVVVVFLGLMAFCVFARDPWEYSPVQWLVIGCVAVVVGIFFYHSLSVAEISVRSRHPVWAGFVMAVGLIVLPQYLSREAFLWALSRLAALLVVVTLPIYFVGEYTVFGLAFTFNDGFSIPLLGSDVRATRSLFVWRNAFATVVFAGVVAALGEFHRSITRPGHDRARLLAGGLLAINALGLVLSYGRALWVITPMAIGVYLAYVVYGRRAVPLAVLAAFGYLAIGIAVVQSGLLPLPSSTPTRELRWYPALRAVLDRPSLLGAGLVDPGQFVAQYGPTDSTYSPHNSYLTMAIRAGVLGGIANLVIVVGSLIDGAFHDNDSSVAVTVLALAVGYAAHQQFEAYTLFSWDSSAILAILAVGFLVFGRRDRSVTPTEH